MTKQELVNVFILRAAPAEREALHPILEKMSKEELEMAHEALVAQIQLQAREEEIFRIRADSAADQALHQFRTQKAREPQRLAEEKAQLEKDRATFNEAAKTLRSFGLTEANFNVIRQILGSGFSVYQIQEMLVANGAILSGPSQQELDGWTREAIEIHNSRLKAMDIPTLRKLAREAGARGPATPQPDETQRIRAATENFYGTAYPQLPDEFRDGNGPEQVLNAAFIKKCSKETLRTLIKRYGSDQVTEALRTRTDGIYQY